MNNNLLGLNKYSTTRMLTRDSPKPKSIMGETFTSLTSLPPNNKRFGEGGLRLLGFHKKLAVGQPLITIIIAVYNGEAHIEETILSILNQSYNNVELIIIDGGSSDNTLKILRKYNESINYWVSEKDKGISDAFNKAVTVACGDFINFQGDGDGFFNHFVLEALFHKRRYEADIGFVCGRIKRISVDGQAMYVSNIKMPFRKSSLLFRMSMPHQGLFTSINYFKQYGLFDVSNTYCMDYEHLLRAFHVFPKVVIQDIIVANWRADGLGNGKDLDIFKEYYKIKKDNKIAPAPILFLINIWTLFKFYVKKWIK